MNDLRFPLPADEDLTPEKVERLIERLTDLVVVREREVVWGCHTLKVQAGSRPATNNGPCCMGDTDA
jgi:hypothetical protein